MKIVFDKNYFSSSKKSDFLFKTISFRFKNGFPPKTWSQRIVVVTFFSLNFSNNFMHFDACWPKIKFRKINRNLSME